MVVATKGVVYGLRPGSPTLETWLSTNDYQVWTSCVPAVEDTLVLWEQVKDGGVIRIPDQPTVAHVITAGTPHHIQGLFGYWRTSGADILWVKFVRGGWVHLTMLLGGGRGGDVLKDTISWICPRCAHMLASEEAVFRRSDMKDFWDAEKFAVEKFNSSEHHRTCAECGTVHPPAYGFVNSQRMSKNRLDW